MAKTGVSRGFFFIRLDWNRVPPRLELVMDPVTASKVNVNNREMLENVREHHAIPGRFVGQTNHGRRFGFAPGLPIRTDSVDLVRVGISVASVEQTSTCPNCDGNGYLLSSRPLGECKLCGNRGFLVSESKRGLRANELTAVNIALLTCALDNLGVDGDSHLRVFTTANVGTYHIAGKLAKRSVEILGQHNRGDHLYFAVESIQNFARRVYPHNSRFGDLGLYPCVDLGAPVAGAVAIQLGPASIYCADEIESDGRLYFCDKDSETPEHQLLLLAGLAEVWRYLRGRDPV